MRISKLAAIAAVTLPVVLSVRAAQAQPDEPPPTDDPEEPTPPEPPPTPEHEQLLEQARQALGNGEVDQACELFGKSHDLSPSEDVQFELAQCLERADKPTEAAEAYDKVAAAEGARAAEAQRRAVAIREQLAKVAEPDAPPTGDEAPKGEKKPAPAAEDEDPYVFSDFMDTRLTWTFGDDDLLHDTGMTVPISPNANIGDRRQYRLFFDNLNSRFGGRENLTHLVLYKKMPGFIDRLDTEASLVLRFNIGALSEKRNNVDQSLTDAGSFIRLFLRTGEASNEEEGVGLTLWPLDTDRFRLGYLYDISWGGTNASINQSIFPRIQGSSPGFKFQYDHKIFNLFFGMKTAEIVQVQEILTPGTAEVEVIRVGETNYGFLGGGALRLGDYFSADLGVGYFQQGKFDLPDVLGESVYTFGGSARLAAHSANSGVSQSVDFALYRNDPMKHEALLKQSTYDPDETSWSVAVEGSNLWQHLKDFDATGETQLQAARTVALQGNMTTGFFRVSLTGIYRDLKFVLRNVPSYVPFETVPAGADVGDEIFVAAAADYHFDGPKLTPGLGAGLQFPATFTTSASNEFGETIGRTVVVRQQGDFSILPQDRDSVPIFQARASLKWDASEILSWLAWVQFVRDNNGTFVERDPNEGTVALRTFNSPNFFGFGTSVQARF